MTNSLSQFDSTAEKALTEMARKLDLVAIGKKTGRNRTTKKKSTAGSSSLSRHEDQ